eukprot:3945732-Pyramimonas_sp.AAC.1
MGPRLYSALKDKAFDHVEDEKPSVFAVPDGVELLLQKLAYFDQRPTGKIGQARGVFFHMDQIEAGETLLQLATRVDKAVLQAMSVELDIPDPIIIRQFMKSSQLDAKTQATLLMAAGSSFKWKPLQEQAATPFPLPLVPRNKYQGDQKFSPQGNSVNIANADGQADEWPGYGQNDDNDAWQPEEYQADPEYSFENGW